MHANYNQVCTGLGFFYCYSFNIQFILLLLFILLGFILLYFKGFISVAVCVIYVTTYCLIIVLDNLHWW